MTVLHRFNCIFISVFSDIEIGGQCVMIASLAILGLALLSILLLISASVLIFLTIRRRTEPQEEDDKPRLTARGSWNKIADIAIVQSKQDNLRRIQARSRWTSLIKKIKTQKATTGPANATAGLKWLPVHY